MGDASIEAIDRAAIDFAYRVRARQPVCDYTIAQLPAAGAIQSTDLLPIYRNGQTYSALGSSLPNAAVQLGYLNVQSFGALGNGATDDTAAISAAFNAALLAPYGAVVYFPPGNYVVSSPFTVPSNTSVIGAGYDSTQFKCIGTTVTLGLFSATGVSGVHFENFGVSFPTPATAGSVFGFQSTNYIFMRNIGIGNGWNDITMSAGIAAFIEQVFSSKTYLPGAGNTCDAVHLTANATEVHMRDCVFGTSAAGNANACRSGLNFDSAQQVVVTNCDIMQFMYGLYVNPLVNSSFYNSYFLETVFDYCSSYGVYLASSYASSKVYLLKFTSCWTGGAQTNGFHIINSIGTIDAIQILGHQSVNCQVNGLYMSGNITNTIVSGGFFIANTVSGLGAGISVYGTTRCKIFGNTCGNITIYAATQVYGIQFDATNTALTVEGNECSNNTTLGIYVAGSTSTYRIRNNNGYNPVGHLTTSPAFTSGTALVNPTGVDATVIVTGGTVSAIAIGGVATGLTTGSFRLPAGQSITITYSAAPTTSWYLD